MLRSDVVNEVLKLYPDPSYLEIGVDEGTTFFSVSAPRKVAVDPAFKFSTPSEAAETIAFEAMTSDAFFSKSFDLKFDVIFIDGLHTFEQTLRDFTNATHFISSNGVIIIDDIMPSSYYASLPDLELSVKVRLATGGKDGDWMGDVYKLVFFIETFFPQYSFATVAETQAQLVLWKQPRTSEKIVYRTVKSIAEMEYAQIALHGPTNSTPLNEILFMLKDSIAKYVPNQ